MTQPSAPRPTAATRQPGYRRRTSAIQSSGRPASRSWLRKSTSAASNHGRCSSSSMSAAMCMSTATGSRSSSFDTPRNGLPNGWLVTTARSAVTACSMYRSIG
jgi:hypothetical protein